MDNKVPTIECKLTATNYNLWIFQMKALLLDQECILIEAEPVIGGHPLRLNDSKPRSQLCIIKNCSQEILPSLMHFSAANEMWDYLYKMYSGENAARKLAGIKKLAGTKFLSVSTLEENFQRLDSTLAETITAAGSATINLSELAVTMFVDTLPSRFNSVRTFIETHDPPLKYSEIRNYLVADDQRQAQRVDTTPFAGLVASDKCPMQERNQNVGLAIQSFIQN